MTEIDPLTGLPLKVIQPGPPQRASAFEQPTPMGFTQTQPISTPMMTAEPVIVPEVTSPLPESSFGQKLLFALTGAPDSDLSADKLAARESRRRGAGQLAASASENPGEAFMGPADSGGGSALESLGKIVRLFGGGGG